METIQKAKESPAYEALPAETKNGLPASVRGRMAGLLNQNLADAVDLQTQCKQAHWNVKGPAFYGLHRLFDDVHAAVSAYADLLAERAVQLGGQALGTARAAAGASRLPPYPLSPADGQSHVEVLSTALASFGKSVREAAADAEEAGDAGTSDIFIEISRGADRWLWFVESHLRGKT
jgi:starvation-inducible DNA-binding protein